MRDHQESEVKALRRAAGCRRLLFDLKNHVHDRVRKVRLGRRAEEFKIRLGKQPARLEPDQRRRGWIIRSLKIDASLLSARGKAIFGLIERGDDSTVALGVRNMAVKGIRTEH